MDLIGCIEEAQAALQAARSLPQHRRLLRALSLACASLSFYLSLLNAPSAQSSTKSLDISGSITYAISQDLRQVQRVKFGHGIKPFLLVHTRGRCR